LAPIQAVAEASGSDGVSFMSMNIVLQRKILPSFHRDCACIGIHPP